jgi:hypothetical protein
MGNVGGFFMLDFTAEAPSPICLRSRRMRDPFVLPGMDRRTSDGRRFRDTVIMLVSEFGDRDAVRIRELATLRLTLEREQARIVADPKRSSRDLVRLSDTITAKEEELRTRNSLLALGEAL